MIRSFSMASYRIRSAFFYLLLTLTLSFQACRTGSPVTADHPIGQHSDSSVTGQPYAPSLLSEFRAAWVATVANIDWPSQPGLTTDQQKEELIRILDRAASLHLNAVLFQVRPAGDAFYKSSYEPWSPWLTGEMGKAPEPYYDPLEFAVKEAHKRGLELHAWFNPYRVGHSSHSGTYSDDHISVTHPHLVHQYGDFLWLDPGLPEAREHTLRVILDVVRRYDIDAVHFDDYFYPYPSYAGGADFPDSLSWNKAADPNILISRDEWRRENVNQLIRELYDRIREVKPFVRFGISPFGIWRPGTPWLTTGFDTYRELHADARLWLNSGWVDYFSPQIYYRTDQIAQPFPVILNWWSDENIKQRHLWPGLYTSRLWTEENLWQSSEITGQVYTARAFPGVTGVIHFSMKTFLQNSQQINQILTSGPYALPAVVPATPWLDEPLPAPPLFSVTENEQQWRLRFYHDPDNRIRNRVLQIRRNGNTDSVTIPGSRKELIFDNSHRILPDSFSLFSMNQTGGTSSSVEYYFQKPAPFPKFSDPAILPRSVWSEEPAAGIHAHAARLSGGVEDTLRFEDLSLTIHSLMRSMAFPDRLLKLDLGEVMDGDNYSELVSFSLRRGDVTETVSMQSGTAMNWYGYHISLLKTDFQREIAHFELATTGSLSVSRASQRVPGDHRQRFRIPHLVNRIVYIQTSLPPHTDQGSGFKDRLRSYQEFSQNLNLFTDIPHHFYISPDGDIYEGRNPSIAGDTAGRMNPAGALLIWLPSTLTSDESEAASEAALRLTTNLMQHFDLDHSDLCMSDAAESNCVYACFGEECDKWDRDNLRNWLREQVIAGEL